MNLPLAQVELMATDQSIVVYPKTDKVEKGKGKFQTFTRPERSALDKANERWAQRLARKEAQKKSQSITENG